MNKSLPSSIFTGRNEVVAGVIFLHLFVILFTGGVSASLHAGILPRTRPPPKQTPLEQTTPRGRHPRADTPCSRHSPTRADTPPPEQTSPLEQTPPPVESRLWHTVNERPVRILLECILVLFSCSFGKRISPVWGSLPMSDKSLDPSHLSRYFKTLTRINIQHLYNGFL